MHQYQLYPEAVEQGDIVNQTGECRVGHAFSAEGDNKYAAPEGVDVGGCLAKPGDKLLVGFFLSQLWAPKISKNTLATSATCRKGAKLFIVLQQVNGIVDNRMIYGQIVD